MPSIGPVQFHALAGYVAEPGLRRDDFPDADDPGLF